MPEAAVSPVPLPAGCLPAPVRGQPRRAASTAPAGGVTGGVTGGAARPLSPPRAAAGPLPPSPGAAAGGSMEQGLSAITLYCAPAAGAMEPEQVSGAGGRRGRGAAASGAGRGRGGSGRAVGGGRGLSSRGCAGMGEPLFPAVAVGCSGPAAGAEVCLSAGLSFHPARYNYSQHACLRCLLLVGGQCL